MWQHMLLLNNNCYERWGGPHPANHVLSYFTRTHGVLKQFKDGASGLLKLPVINFEQLYLLIYLRRDHDMAVPHTGSEAWTSGLGLEVQSKWSPWYLGNQV